MNYQHHGTDGGTLEPVSLLLIANWLMTVVSHSFLSLTLSMWLSLSLSSTCLCLPFVFDIFGFVFESFTWLCLPLVLSPHQPEAVVSSGVPLQLLARPSPDVVFLQKILKVSPSWSLIVITSPSPDVFLFFRRSSRCHHHDHWLSSPQDGLVSWPRSPSLLLAPWRFPSQLRQQASFPELTLPFLCFLSFFWKCGNLEIALRVLHPYFSVSLSSSIFPCLYVCYEPVN